MVASPSRYDCLYTDKCSLVIRHTRDLCNPRFVIYMTTYGALTYAARGVGPYRAKGADGLVAGGKAGIYTVMYFTAAKKPLN